jgi:CheY-like chemotaxis protein
VLVNLITNAIKYNSENGTVEVSCAYSTPGRIRLSISDTGAGLNPDELAQLFQPFNRLGQELGTVEGTGIGLVVAKRLINLMGGNIGVESTVGKGSVFWCELIAVAEPRHIAKSSHIADIMKVQPPRSARPHTILYVEDNPANLKLVKQIFARLPDFRLLTAMDADLGIQIARNKQPEVILMDINLPGMSGFDALKILRADPVTSHIPVIAVSANAMLADIARALQSGFFRYITKPIEIGELIEGVDLALKHIESEGKC